MELDKYYISGSYDMDVEIYCYTCPYHMIDWSGRFDLARIIEICDQHSKEKHSDD